MLSVEHLVLFVNAHEQLVPWFTYKQGRIENSIWEVVSSGFILPATKLRAFSFPSQKPNPLKHEAFHGFCGQVYVIIDSHWANSSQLTQT